MWEQERSGTWLSSRFRAVCESLARRLVEFGWFRRASLSFVSNMCVCVCLFSNSFNLLVTYKDRALRRTQIDRTDSRSNSCRLGFEYKDRSCKKKRRIYWLVYFLKRANSMTSRSRTRVDMGKAMRKKIMQMVKRNNVFLVLVLILCENRSASELSTHSQRLSELPKPMVIIMRKKRTHQSWGSGMSDNASA